MTDPEPDGAPQEASLGAAPGKTLSDAARRALAEAAMRRAAAPAPEAEGHERGGPLGPEPTRFGDWEHKGLAIDF